MTEPNDPEDAEWAEMMTRPVTRAELLQITQLVQLNLLSHSLLGTSLIEDDEKLQRDIAEKTVDHAMKIGSTMKSMIERWKLER